MSQCVLYERKSGGHFSLSGCWATEHKVPCENFLPFFIFFILHLLLLLIPHSLWSKAKKGQHRPKEQVLSLWRHAEFHGLFIYTACVCVCVYTQLWASIAHVLLIYSLSLWPQKRVKRMRLIDSILYARTLVARSAGG